jgi:myosin-5
LRSFKISAGCECLSQSSRLSPNQIQKLLNQYLVADYEQPINGEIMKAVASRVTEKSDVLLLTAVDMDDSGPYEIAEPRVITALETYTPSCEYTAANTHCTIISV